MLFAMMQALAVHRLALLTQQVRVQVHLHRILFNLHEMLLLVLCKHC